MRPSWASNTDLGRGKGRQDPLNMEANLASKNQVFEAQVGFHFWGGLGGPWAPQSIFLEDKKAPQKILKLVFENKFLGIPSGLHFGRGLDCQEPPIEIFLGAQVGWRVRNGVPRRG